MITYYNISKEYPDGTIALQDINLEIDEGEFVLIVGPSGAGKSTLFKLLVREELPTVGEIYLGDLVVTDLKERHLPKLRREVGMIFQDFKLLPSLTVSENIAFPLQVMGKAKPEIEEIVPEVLDLVGLIDRSHVFPKHLSGGEKQKLSIARAISTEPSILVADEPTGNIDYDSTWAVIELLTKINDLGTTVVLTTHDPEIVEKLNKRVVSIDKGRIIADQKEKSKK